ncbi:MAG: GNAT family N-acetyltransferase [Candidatus Margulisiibacteriota bacterium]
MGIILRKAEIMDCRDVFEWRNDPAVRNMSLDQRPIKDTDHDKWFNNSLKNPDRDLIIAESEGKKIGVVRVDRLNEYSGEISINLAPDSRGKGFGPEILRLFSRTELTAGGYKILIARIKNTNPNSVKAFEKAGYKKLLEYTSNSGELIIIMSKAGELYDE